jgi:hypothetical protein
MLQGATPTIAPILPYGTMLALSLEAISYDGGGALNSNPAIVYVMVKHNPNYIGTTGGNIPGTTITQAIVPNNYAISAPPEPNSAPSTSSPQTESPRSTVVYEGS